MFTGQYKSKVTPSKLGVLGPWIHGVQQPQSSRGFLHGTELTDAINVFAVKGGILTARPPIKQLVSQLGGKVLTLYAPQTGRNLLAVIDGVGLKRINVDTGGVTLISTVVSSEATFFEYKDHIVICDGGYVKLLNPSSWTVSLAWDEGSEGMMHSGSRNIPDAGIALRNGGNTRVACKITTPQWGTTFTIPPRKIEALIGRAGSPSGAIYARVRRVATDERIGEAVLCDADDLPGVGYAVFSTFLTALGQMSQETEYYISIEYAGGDADNYVKVGAVSDATSPDTYVYTSSWSGVNYRACISLYPSLPPKARFGCVWNGRPWVAGSSDAPGVVYYGNLSVYDWSTPGGGGYIGMIEDSANTFPVGGMGPALDSLFVFGTSSAPYLSRIYGHSPSEYVQAVIQIHGEAKPKTVVPVVNDLWVAHGESVWRVAGVTEFGDVRSSSASDAIKGALQDIDEMVYYPELGAVIARDDDKLWVCNVHAPVKDTVSDITRYPWVQWELYDKDFTNKVEYEWVERPDGARYVVRAGTGGAPFTTAPDKVATLWKNLSKVDAFSDLYQSGFYIGDEDNLGFDTIYVTSGYQQNNMICSLLTPTALCCAHSRLYVGTKDGRVFMSDEDYDQDRMYPRIRTGGVTASVSSILLQYIIPEIHCLLGGTALVELYRSTERDPYIVYTQPIEGASDVDVDSLDIPINAANINIFPPSVGGRAYRVHSHVRSFRIGVVMIEMLSSSTSVRSIRYAYRPLRF